MMSFIGLVCLFIWNVTIHKDPPEDTSRGLFTFVTILVAYQFVATVNYIVFELVEETIIIYEEEHFVLIRNTRFSDSSEKYSKKDVKSVEVRQHMFGFMDACTLRIDFYN